MQFYLASPKQGWALVSRRQQSLLFGSLLLILSELLLVAMAATIKFTANYLPIASIVFLRNLLVIFILMPWLLHRGLLQQVRTQRLHLHLLRSSAGVSAMFCFFYAVAHLPLAEANMIKMASPFFIPIIGFLWLREHISWQIVFAICLGLLGVVVIFQPNASVSNTFSFVALIGVLGGIFAALAKVTIRKMTDTEPTVRIVFYFALFGTLISGIPMLWWWVTPTPIGWALVFALSLLGTLGQLAMTKAFSFAPAAQIAPFGYVSVIFAMSFGWIFWNEQLDTAFFIGTALIILAGLSLSYQKPR